MMEDKIKKLEEWVNKNYSPNKCGWTAERSMGNYDDCFDDGMQVGTSYSTYEDDDEEIDLLESIDEDEEVDKLIEELKIEIRPHMITHKFEISSINEAFIYCGNIIDAMDETKDCEGDLYLVENGQYKIVYSCQGLEIEDNNDCLREFGVYEDDDNCVRLIDKSYLV